MADFTRKSVADMAADNPGIDLGTSGALHEIDWGTEDAFWREEYARRPYARADRDYSYFEHAYKYGALARTRHAGREWHEVEPELESGWQAFRGKTKSTWAEMKDAVRDAFHRPEFRAPFFANMGGIERMIALQMRDENGVDPFETETLLSPR